MRETTLLIALLIIFIIMIFMRIAPTKIVKRAYPGDVVMAILAILILLVILGYL
jgi:hypothetical protein